MRFFALLTSIFLLVSCGGSINYQDPLRGGKDMYYTVIDKPRDAVWNASIPELGKKIFVINNIDKSSGLINLSYSGNPEDYIDCGRIISQVQNLRGKRTYDFAGASPYQAYEVMTGGKLFGVQRKISLEGRMNLIFEEMSPSKTKVTANTRYIVSRNVIVKSANPNEFPQTINDSISFNTGSGASFPSASDGRALKCVPTGVLENSILSMIK